MPADTTDVSSASFHRGTADAHHQHATVFAYGFVIDIDTDHRISTQRFRLFAQLLKSNFTRFTQLFFIRAGATTDNIANAGEEIAEDIRA